MVDERKADRLLESTRRRLRTVVRRTTDGIVGVGRDGRIGYANPAICAALGLERSDIVGRSLLDFVQPDDATSAWEVILADPTAADHGPLEVRVRHADGSFVSFEGHRSNLMDDGDFGGVLWILRNVNDTRTAEKALAQHQALLHALAATSPDVTFVIGADERVRYASPSAEHVFGLRPADLIGVPVEELRSTLVHPDDRSRIAALDALAAPAGATGTVRYRIAHPDGGWRWVEASYRNMLDDPSVEGLVMDIRDITGAHDADLALRESESRFRAIVEAADEGIWMFDDQGNTRLANPKMAALIGVAPELMTQTAVGQYFADPTDVELAQARRARRLRGESERYETRLRHVDGTIVDVYVSASPLFDAEGRVYGSISMVTDLTDYKRVERERARLQEQREQDQRLASLGKLAGGIAHDFNNLLGVILNYATLIERGMVEGSVRDDIHQIRLAAERAASLTTQLLSFASRQDLRPEPIALNSLVAGFAQMASRTLGDGLDVRLDLDPRVPEPTVEFDPHQLERILLNLAINARDAMPDGGVLTIRTTFLPPDPTDRDHRGPWMRLAVSDTGHGMTADVANRAFEPFFTTKQVGDGTGLGLATVHGVVAQGGGRTSITSAPDQGTTVEILLPAYDVSESPASDPPSLAAPGHERLVLVEDEPSLRSATARLLAAQGYEVLEAEHGEEALAVLAAATAPIDLVITDLAMPHMSGHELGAVLATTHPGLPVIYLSGYDSPKHNATHLPVLRKPVPVDLLLSTIRQALDRG